MLSVRIMRLSGISGHDVDGLVLSLSWVALYTHHECDLPQAGTRPYMTMDVARLQNSNKQTGVPACNKYAAKIKWVITINFIYHIM